MDDIYAGFDLPEEHAKREQPTEAKEGESKAENKAAASLDVEIAQAMQSLGTVGTQLTSFWGSFRKQSTTAYNASVKELETRTEAAKKDFAPYVSKAREELTKFGEQARNSAAAGQAASVSSPPSSDAVTSQEPSVSFYGEVLPPSNNTASENSINAAAFFKSLSSTIQHNPNLAKLQQNLSTNPNLKNFQKGFTSFQQSSTEAFKHPEEFMSKAGKYLNSAVSIVPPSASVEEKGKMRQEKMQEVLGRKQGLKHQLQTNVAILLVDPKEGQEGNAEWDEFVKGIEAQGGVQGELWQTKIEEEMKDSTAIGKTLQTLVPEKLTADVFWSRYFFRLQQIEQDEARRKQVLETATAQSEDDFSWDMEDEDAPVSPPAVDRSTPTLKPAAEAEPDSPTIEKSSARNSSEEGTESSYALVSGPPSVAASEKGEPKAVEKVEVKKDEKAAKKQDESDEDSDWE